MSFCRGNDDDKSNLFVELFHLVSSPEYYHISLFNAVNVAESLPPLHAQLTRVPANIFGLSEMHLILSTFFKTTMETSIQCKHRQLALN